MPSDKNTPTRRALSMASMGADIAGSYIGYLLQRAFLGDAQGESKLKSTHTLIISNSLSGAWHFGCCAHASFIR
jgi:hypothetical protein